MSSPKYATPLRLRLEPSRGLAVVYVALAAGGLGVVAWAGLPWVSWLGLALAAAGLCMPILRRHAWLSSPAAVVALSWESDGRWLLTRADGSQCEAWLQGDSLSHARLVVLNFRRPGRLWPVSVLLTPGRVGRQAFRRLRVRLKLDGTGEQLADLV